VLLFDEESTLLIISKGESFTVLQYFTMLHNLQFVIRSGGLDVLALQRTFTDGGVIIGFRVKECLCVVSYDVLRFSLIWLVHICFKPLMCSVAIRKLSYISKPFMSTHLILTFLFM